MTKFVIRQQNSIPNGFIYIIMRKDRVILGLTLATAIILMASCGTAKNNISNKKNNKHDTALSQDSTSKPHFQMENHTKAHYF